MSKRFYKQQQAKKTLKDAIKQAQAGKIDFEMFIKLAGLAGVGLWEADLTAMKVTYIDNTGNDLVIEPIPSI
ncbi:Undefined function [Listeria monocytogenes N53-1]|nr:Undefined function [Listeria monocytogenes]CCQ23101.1 Undefined function [Listeria monocytogenes N53-1]